MRHIAPTNQGQATGRPQQPVDGAVGQRPGACGLQFLPGSGAVKHIQHTTVADDGNLLAWVASGNLTHNTLDAIAQCQQ